MPSISSLNLCCYNTIDAVKRDCMECFKKCCRKDHGGLFKRDTVLTCVKLGKYEMYDYLVKNQKMFATRCEEDGGALTFHIPDNKCLASWAIPHGTDDKWMELYKAADDEITNVQRVGLLKLSLEHANLLAGNIFVRNLKQRTQSAMKKDLKQYMESAVYSGKLFVIQWVETHFNNGSINNPWPPWPTEWRDNGSGLFNALVSNPNSKPKRRSWSNNEDFLLKSQILADVFGYVFNPNSVKSRINPTHKDFFITSAIKWADSKCFEDLQGDPRARDGRPNALFRAVWDMITVEDNFRVGLDGRNWKKLCIRHNRICTLKAIHDKIPEWPSDFLDSCGSINGYRTYERRLLREWAIENGLVQFQLMDADRIQERQNNAVPVPPTNEKVTNLQKALALIEESNLPEGRYLEICNIMMDIHRRGVRIM